MNWINRAPIYNPDPIPPLWSGGAEGVGELIGRLMSQRSSLPRTHVAPAADLFDGPVGRRPNGRATGQTDALTDGAPLEPGDHLFDVVESLGGCCLTLDGGWRVTAITPAAAEWIGLKRDGAMGRDACRDLALAPGLVEAVEAAFATGEPTRAILPWERHPGVWGEYQILPFAEAANIVFWALADAQLAALSRATCDEGGPVNPLANISGRALVIDRAWRIAGISPQAAAWASGMSAALIGRDIRQIWPVPEGVPQVLQRAFATGDSRTVEFASGLRPGRWVELRFHPFSEGAFLLFSDVTERRQAAESARSTAQILQGLTEAVSGEMAVLDERGRVLSVNEAWRAAQPNSSDGVGEPYAEVLLRVAGVVDETAIRGEIDDLLTGFAESFIYVSAVPIAGEVRWREFRVTPLAVAGARRFLAVHQDLTGYARMQDELNRTAEQLLEAQDDERERIAAELHDSTSQHLIALNMGVMRLKRLMGNRKSASEVLQDMTASVQEALREIRVLSYLLRPADLERDGLRLAAERFVVGFGARTGLKTSFRAVGDLDEVSDEVRHACFRVVQEALANVFRHAQAQSAHVEIVCRKGHLVARIADDGKGIPALDGSEGPVTLGVGIPGMRARAAQLGGALEIAGGRRGTIITAILPLQGPDAPAHRAR